MALLKIYLLTSSFVLNAEISLIDIYIIPTFYNVHDLSANLVSVQNM